MASGVDEDEVILVSSLGFGFDFNAETESKPNPFKVNVDAMSEHKLAKLFHQGISEREKVKYLLEEGCPLQYVAAYNHIPRIVESDISSGCEIETFISEILHTSKSILTYTFASLVEKSETIGALVTCIEKLSQIMQPFLLHRHIFPFLLLVLDHCDVQGPTLDNGFVGEKISGKHPDMFFLLENVCLQQKDQDRQELFGKLHQVVLAKTDFKETFKNRFIGVKLYGILIRCCGMKGSETIFKLGTSMCQDVDAGIRVCMCEQLVSLLQEAQLQPAVLAAHYEQAIVTEMCELLRDEEDIVVAAALGCSFGATRFLSKSLMKEYFLPIWTKMYSKSVSIQNLSANQQARKSATTLVLANLVGKVLFYLHEAGIADKTSETGIEVSELFISSYISYSKWTPIRQKEKEIEKGMETEKGNGAELSIDEKIRLMCAYNLPGVLKTLLDTKHANAIIATYLNLTHDQSVEIRRAAAGGLHIVCSILQKLKLDEFFLDVLTRLLKDEYAKVRNAVIDNFPETIGYFDVPDKTRNQKNFKEILAALFNSLSGNCVLHDWRFKVKCIDSLTRMLKYLEPHGLHIQLFPVLISNMKQECEKVYDVCARTFCHVLSNYECTVQPSSLSRDDIIENMKREFQSHDSSTRRLVYVCLLKHALSHFSWQFFLANFCHGALQLFQDPVVGVRLRMCELIPQIYKVFRNVNDQSREDLRNSFENLLHEKLPLDLSSLVREKIIEFDLQKASIEVFNTSEFEENALKHNREKKFCLRGLNLRRLSLNYQEHINRLNQERKNSSSSCDGAFPSVSTTPLTWNSHLKPKDVKMQKVKSKCTPMSPKHRPMHSLSPRKRTFIPIG